MTKKEIIEALINQMEKDEQYEDYKKASSDLAKLLRTTIDEFKKQGLSEDIAFQVFMENLRGAYERCD